MRPRWQLALCGAGREADRFAFRSGAPGVAKPGVLAMLIGCGLRRAEVVTVSVEYFELRGVQMSRRMNPVVRARRCGRNRVITVDRPPSVRPQSQYRATLRNRQRDAVPIGFRKLMEHVKVNGSRLVLRSDCICKRRLAVVRRPHDADAFSELAEFQHCSQFGYYIRSSCLPTQDG